MHPGGRCTNNRIGPGVGPFSNDVNLIDCSFSTTNGNDVIRGRSYAGPILPLVQRPPGIWVACVVYTRNVGAVRKQPASKDNTAMLTWISYAGT